MPIQDSTKPCVVCGRTITWRKKWERNWDEVKYCSSACRRQKLQPVDHDLEAAILHVLGQRATGATICPSEAAKHVTLEDGDEGWRALMEASRQAARRLVVAEKVVITQKGQVVDPSTAKGPIRIRLR